MLRKKKIFNSPLQKLFNRRFLDTPCLSIIYLQWTMVYGTTIKFSENIELSLVMHFGLIIKESKVSSLKLQIFGDFGSLLHKLYQGLLKNPY